MIVLLFWVVLGFADDCFRVYSRLFSVDLGLVSVRFRVYFRFIQVGIIFGVLSKSCGLLRSDLMLLRY